MSERLKSIGSTIWRGLVALRVTFWFWFLPLAAGIGVGALVCLLAFVGKDVCDFYAKNLRASLFSGFLSLGGFLLSLKTFVVVKVKEGLYDHARYRERVMTRQRLNKNLSFYGPVRRLSRLLFAAVCMAIATAIAQLTLGLINHWSAVALGLGLVAATLTVLLETLFVIRANLNDWFDFLEEDAISEARAKTQPPTPPAS